MQGELQQRQASQTRSWPMYRALVGVGMLCGLLIVSVFVVTLPVIEKNQAEALERAVFRVLPGAISMRVFLLGEDGLFRPAAADDPPARLVYAGFGDGGELVGVAVQSQGMGYQDIIRVAWGYAPQAQAIVGMQVLASKETPGLGDKIEKDPAFLRNFESLDVSLDVSGAALNNAIEAVKSGEKTQPWQIDGITGATISSKAIANILREGSRQWVPLIFQQRAIFQPQADFQPQGGIDDES